jgi:hypothetical protein
LVFLIVPTVLATEHALCIISYRALTSKLKIKT